MSVVVVFVQNRREETTTTTAGRQQPTTTDDDSRCGWMDGRIIDGWGGWMDETTDNRVRSGKKKTADRQAGACIHRHR